MQISAFSHPKRRDRAVASDDTVLMTPGLFGVFDGATDARAQIVGGRSSGRFASETAAAECAALFATPEGFDLPATAIAARINAAIRDRAPGFEGRPTTTLALAARQGDRVRLLTIGDSGIRLNGARVLRHFKPIDDVSTAARLRVFAALESIQDPDARETATRQVIFMGLDRAAADGRLAPATIDTILAEVTAELGHRLAPAPIIEFLRAGIIGQSRYANLPGHPLGYSALNGTETTADDIVEAFLPIEEVETLELFTDGYFALPEGRSLADWEDAAAAVEAQDFHMRAAYPNVKGATSAEFADDRAILILDRR